MAGERLQAGFSLRSQLWFRWTGKCFETATSHMQNVSCKVTTTNKNIHKMKSVDAYIYIIIGLLGVAYPILLQVVARLDEKYESEQIVKLFNKEWEGNAFQYSLYSSLVLVVIWSLKLPPLIQFNGHLKFLIENSADILVGFNTILLVIFFFLYVRKVLIYYTQTDLISYLIKKHYEG